MEDDSPSGEMALELGPKEWENWLRKHQTVMWREQTTSGVRSNSCLAGSSRGFLWERKLGS